VFDDVASITSKHVLSLKGWRGTNCMFHVLPCKQKLQSILKFYLSVRLFLCIFQSTMYCMITTPKTRVVFGDTRCYWPNSHSVKSPAHPRTHKPLKSWGIRSGNPSQQAKQAPVAPMLGIQTVAPSLLDWSELIPYADCDAQIVRNKIRNCVKCRKLIQHDGTVVYWIIRLKIINSHSLSKVGNLTEWRPWH
jgi:hypothetical protein